MRLHGISVVGLAHLLIDDGATGGGDGDDGDGDDDNGDGKCGTFSLLSAVGVMLRLLFAQPGGCCCRCSRMPLDVSANAAMGI